MHTHTHRRTVVLIQLHSVSIEEHKKLNTSRSVVQAVLLLVVSVVTSFINHKESKKGPGLKKWEKDPVIKT